jgi:DNA polymerase V
MREAICEFTARAAAKLRARKQKASSLCVFIRTSPHDKYHYYYSNSSQGSFYEATSDTLDMVALSGKLLERIWKEDQRYAKAGVMLSDLCAEDEVQQSLLCSGKDQHKSRNLMQAMDKINQSDLGKIYLGSQRREKEWFMKRDLLSPRYTTKWEDIPVVE